MLHTTRKILLQLAVCLVQLPLLSRANYQLQVTAVGYDNPSHRRSGGDCCDLFCGDCETHLKFCLRPPGYSNVVAEECPLGERTAGAVGDDSITFGNTVGSLPNPFSIPVQDSWLGSFQILVEVFDADDFTDDDFVDIIFGAPFNLSVGSSTTQTYSGRQAQITLMFQVLCATYYYGPNCDVFCEEADNNEKGHYTCDPQSGERVCRPGYSDPSTNCITAVEEPTLPVPSTTINATNTQDGHSIAIATPTTVLPESAVTSTGQECASSSTTKIAAVTPADITTSANIIANQQSNGRSMAGVIVGPLVAIVVVIATVIITLVVFLLCRRHRNSSKFSSDDLSERMLVPQTSINDGIPNAMYDPTSAGVVYVGAGTNTERTFNNPLYQSAKLTNADHDSLDDGDHDPKSNSGLYSTIDNRSPRRSWAPRPTQNGQYSVITDPH